jgi:hypothetical protein
VESVAVPGILFCGVMHLLHVAPTILQRKARAALDNLLPSLTLTLMIQKIPVVIQIKLNAFCNFLYI